MRATFFFTKVSLFFTMWLLLSLNTMAFRIYLDWAWQTNTCRTINLVIGYLASQGLICFVPKRGEPHPGSASDRTFQNKKNLTHGGKIALGRYYIKTDCTASARGKTLAAQNAKRSAIQGDDRSSAISGVPAGRPLRERPGMQGRCSGGPHCFNQKNVITHKSKNQIKFRLYH
jgi:hypothetical protein